MRFEVPQFINIQDKIFGPFTFKEALYLVGGGGICFLIYRILPGFLSWILIIPIASFSVALVWYKPNNRPFIKMVEAYLLYASTQKFYLWRKKDEKPGAANIDRQAAAFPQEGERSQTGEQKLSDLAWSLDILDFDQ